MELKRLNAFLIAVCNSLDHSTGTGPSQSEIIVEVVFAAIKKLFFWSPGLSRRRFENDFRSFSLRPDG